jgi:predicted restriction endonuclease
VKLPDAAKSRAVLIGPSQYKFMPELPAVANNLTGLHEALCNQDIWGIPPQYCKKVSEPIDRIAMLDSVREASLAATDTLILYFAGHGVLDQRGGLHLAHCETDEQRIYTGIPFENVRDLLLESRAARCIVILDCCYSGNALGVMASDLSPIVDDASVEGAYVLAAAPENKKALSPPGDRFTAFTAEILNILQNGIVEEAELLSLDVIFNHVRSAMHDKGLPAPQKRARNTAGQLVLVRNRAYRQAGLAPMDYGGPTAVKEGTIFPNRNALHKAGIHRPLQAGICGTVSRGGAESIVVSGGYKDDQDYGDVIIYTGHGGQDRNTGSQVRDQEPADSGNAALLQNIVTGLPVRVIRGAGGNPKFSPPVGYSYDGLYSVEEYWSKPSLDGPRIFQFRLEKINDGPGIAPNQWESVASGVYRDRRVSDRVIGWHDFECQVCGKFLEAPYGRRYARALHIQGLGLPHNGPDVAENILCLCPNHCVLFELGSLVINDEFHVIDVVADEVVDDLRMVKDHRVGLEYIRYHRKLHRP